MLPGPDGARATQESQTPQGSGVGPFTQFSDRARIRALDVLTHTRGSLNMEACFIRLVLRECPSGPITCSCLFTSANVAGRYLRYRAKLDPETWVAPSRSDAAAAISSSSPVMGGPPAHPSEPAYPCCHPALGGLAG